MLITEPNRRILEELVKLMRQYEKITSNSNIFFEHISNFQQFNYLFSHNLQSELQNFQNNINRKSFSKMSIRELIPSFVTNFNQLVTEVQQVSLTNLSQIKKIKVKDVNLKITKKTDAFTKAINDYNQQMKNYNKKYYEYQTNCNQLEQMIKKPNNCGNAIFYYSINTDANVNVIERKHQQCEQKQLLLISNLQVIEQKRKILHQNLKDIRDEYLTGLQHQMNIMLDIGRCLSNTKKEAFDARQKEAQNINNEESSNNSERDFSQKKNEKYLMDIDKLLNDIQSRNNINELKAVAKECDGIKNKIYQMLSDIVSVDKLFLSQITKISQLIQKNEKKLQETKKQLWKYDMANYQSQCRKYFGVNIFSVIKISETISSYPIKIYRNVGGLLTDKQKVLLKIEDDRQAELQNLNKISSFATLLQSKLKNHSSSDSLFFKKEFLKIRDTISSSLNKDHSLNKKFTQNFYQIVEFLNTQSYYRMLLNFIKNNPSTFTKVLEEADIAGEIINIVQSDENFNALFNHQVFQSIQPSNFKSLINKNKCKEIQKLLKNKAKNKQKSVFKFQREGCCSVDIKKKPKGLQIKSFLMVNSELRVPGHLIISKKLMKFVEKRSNPFTQKIQLFVPMNEIKGYHKVKMQQQNMLEMQTNVGIIGFFSQQMALLQENLERNSKIKLQKKQSNDDNNQSISKKEKQYSDSSSKNHWQSTSSSFQYKINLKKIKSESILPAFQKQNYTQTLKSLCEECQVFKFFSDKFSHLLASKPIQENGITIIEYNYDDGLSKFLVKESRQVKITNENSNNLIMEFGWKVSFPSYPMIKSFAHFETVTTRFIENVAKISIFQKSRTEQHLLLRSQFYKEVQKMNKKLTDFIAKHCQMQGEVFIGQQQSSHQVGSDSVQFDLNQVGFSKMQSQIKSQK